jgi:hypothetical protein
MRDAESMLDQILASSSGLIDEASVRELLGLADAEAVSTLATALVSGRAAEGLAVLDELDDRGRDVAVVLDQVVDELRDRLAEALDAGDSDRAAALASAARRLAAIDPERRGVGGLRFQLELALLDTATRGQPIAPSRDEPAAKPAPKAEPAPPVNTGAKPVRDAASGDAAAPPTRSPASAPAPTRDGAPASAPAPTRESAPDPTPAAPAPAPAASPSADDEGIDRLRAAWPEVVSLLSQSPPVKPLIAACRPVSVDGAVVTLGFPEDQAFLKDALERRRSILEEGIGRFLGRPVNVRCVATNLEHVPAVPTDTADLIGEARRIFADDLVDVGEVS